jgi:hypothetical protein
LCGYPHWCTRRCRWYLAARQANLEGGEQGLMTIYAHTNGWLSPVAGVFDRAALLAL